VIVESHTAVLRADEAIQARSDRRWFLSAMLVATVLPAIGLSLQRFLDLASVGQLNNGMAFLATGFHVALTSYFYVDPTLREFRQSHRIRFVAAPIAICLASGAVGYFLSPSLGWLILFFFIWQLYHYQRQNFGVLAFAAAVLGVRRASLLEQSTVEMAGYAGILGYLATGHQFGGTPIGHISAVLMIAAQGTQLAALAIAGYCWWRRVRTEGLSWYSPWHVLCTSFFLATFLQSDPNFAFSTYAFAHGLQYVVFMFVLASSRAQNPRLHGPSALILAILGVFGSLILLLLGDRGLFAFSSDVAFGIYTGLVMTHFVIDASVWRLSEPFQRSYVRDGFPMIWNDNAPRRPAA